MIIALSGRGPTAPVHRNLSKLLRHKQNGTYYFCCVRTAKFVLYSIPTVSAVEFVFKMKSSYQIEIEGKLATLVEPVVLEAGAELVELQLVQRKSSALLRLLVDKPGGITLDDCTGISRGVSFLLETADPLEGRYTLEVSSPGLDRPLTTEADFRRKIGEEVRLSVKESERAIEVVGEIVKVENKRLTLMTVEGGRVFPLENVVRGKIIF